MRARYDIEIASALSLWCAGPPQWGRSDCMMALANIDRAVTGIDPAKGWRGRYYTQRTAMRLMGRKGLAGTVTAIARRMRWRALAGAALARAETGDRGIARIQGALVPVVRFRGFWVGRSHCAGHVLVTDMQILRAWALA